jgi:uncharacterized protein
MNTDNRRVFIIMGRIFVFLAFFAIYGGLHFYAFLKLKAAYDLAGRDKNIAAFLLIFMAYLPFIVIMLGHAKMEALARPLAYVAYFWLGILLLFFFSSLAVDIYHLAVRILGALSKKSFSCLLPSARKAFLIPLMISLAANFYGFFEARNIRVKKIVVESAKIPKKTGRIRIVQISDVHLGLILRQDFLEKMIRIIKQNQPDILVSTGDLIDSHIEKKEPLIRALAAIEPKYGKFAVKGNHEYYAGISYAMEFTKEAGFRILQNELTEAGGIVIAGVDDPEGRVIQGNEKPSEKEILEKADRNKFILFLKHRPSAAKSSMGLFDLQLSGHVHGGQLFPFNLVTWFFYPVRASRLIPYEGSYLYVSRGTGTWGPPVRFLCPPEVTVFDVVYAEKK